MSTLDIFIIDKLLKRLNKELKYFEVTYKSNYEIFEPEYDHVIVFHFESPIYRSVDIACKVYYRRDFESIINDFKNTLYEEFEKEIPQSPYKNLLE